MLCFRRNALTRGPAPLIFGYIICRLRQLALRHKLNEMKKITTIFALFLLFTTGLLAQEETPSPREIADAYIEATGGEEAWLAVEAMKMKGTMAMQEMEFPFTATAAEGDRIRIDVDIQGSPMVQAFDGDTAWTLFPLQGITEPKQLSEEESADMKQDHFLSEFINSEERGFKLEAVAGKEVEGTPTYGVRVSKEEEDFDKTYYFDTESMVVIMEESVSKSGPMKGITVETYLSDYEEVDGLMVSKFAESKVNGKSIQKMTIKEVEVNPEIDETIFSMPKK